MQIHRRNLFFSLAALFFLFSGFVALAFHQHSTAQQVRANDGMARAALTSVALNNGNTSVILGSDITSQTDLAPDNGAYRWMATGSAGSTYTAVNLPFNNGSTQTDFSGNGYNATTFGNVSYTSAGCIVGGCLVFDGVDDYAALSTTAPVLNLTSFSISLWAKLTTGGELISNHNNGTAWESFLLSTGNFVLNSANNNTTNRKILPYTFPVDDSWHHVAAVWNGSNMYVYVDGALSAGPLAFTGTPWASTYPVYIGAERSTATAPAIGEVVGNIDELQLYRRALSASQIAQLYADGLIGVGGPTKITSAETFAGQFWNLSVTPITTAGAIDSAMISSNAVVVTTGPSSITGSLNNANEATTLQSTLTTPPGSIAGLQWLVNNVPIMKLSYPFNSGTQIDASGNGYNGTLNGPVFTTSGCKVGGCMSFDGVNDYVVSSGLSDLTDNPSFSVEAWIYVPSTATVTGTYPTFVYWGTASSADAAMFGMYSTSKNQMFIGFNNGGQRMTGTFTNDAWHHAVWTRTGGGNAATGNVLYIDGSSVPLTNDLSSTITPTVTSSAYELQRGGAGADYITAKLDEVKVYNRVLTADEVYRSYLDGLGSGASASDGVGSPTRIVTSGHALDDVWTLIAQEFLSDGSTGSHVYVGSDTIQAAASTTLSIATPSSLQSEDITLTYACSNTDNEVRDIILQYSTNGGSSYSDARLISASSGLASSSTVIGSTCDGSNQTLTWNSLLDQVGINNIQNNTVRVKIIVAMTGNPTSETTNFSVLNPYLFTTSTSIGDGVTTYDNQDITCSGPVTLTLDGAHALARLRVLNGCTVTHTLNTAAVPTLTVAGDVTIDAASSINLNYKGYRGGRSDGNTTSGNGGRYGEGPGGGEGFDCFGCPATGGGGSHGGRGGNGQSGNVNGNAGAVNDSYTNPIDMGSGGGAHTSGSGVGEGGNGGGAIVIVSGGTFTLNGTISADGELAPGGAGGGGAGGTVNITATNWAGSGTITANAGAGKGNGGDGGGGRIALISTSGSIPNYTLLARTGGTSTGQKGGAGTIYKLEPGQDADLTIDNGGYTPFNIDGATPLTATGNFRTIAIQNSGALTALNALTVLTLNANGGTFVSSIDTDHTITTTNVTNGGNLTAITRISATDTSLRITGATLSVDASSTINLNGKGYRGGRTSSMSSTYNGEGPGGTSGGDCFGCPYGIGGAGHGGKGSNGSGGSTNSAGGAANDSLTSPVFMGSGAAGATSGSASSAGGSGGGVVILNLSGTFTNNGAISANGNNGVSKGGGAGGSINITASDLSGSGSFVANGGNAGDVYSGSGAGGRIALIATTGQVSSGYTYQAYAGSGSGQKSGAGTIYVKNSGIDGDLLIDNNSIVPQAAISEDSTPISGAQTLRNITIRNNGVLSVDNAITAQTLDVSNSGSFNSKYNAAHTITTVTASTSGTLTARSRDGNDYSLRINADTVTINSGAFVNLDGKGYRGGRTSTISSTYNGEGPGGTVGGDCFGCTYAIGGAGHGGRGANGAGGSINGAGGAAYGSLTAPLTMGSGGAGSTSGSATSAGGNGGGLVVFVVSGTFTNNGTVSANGNNGVNQAGGAGGGINITAATFTGTGTFTANGGNAGITQSGTGGGGRIALISTAGTLPSYTIQAYAGSGSGQKSAAGTIYLKDTAHADANLRVNNNNTTSAVFTPLFITGEPATYTFFDLYVNNLAKLLVDSPCSGTPAVTVNGTVDLSGGGTITNNQSGTCTLSVTPVSITTTSLPGGVIGTAYNQTLTSSGGYGPATWVCRSGGATVACSTVLPAGLSLSSSGILSGTPTTTGTSTFTVRATEVSPGTGFAEQTFSITVGNAPTAPTNLFSHSTDAQSCCSSSTTDATPVFSAVFGDPDVTNTAVKYRIQVASDASFSTLLWDSGASGTSMAVTAVGARSPNIPYAGAALSLGGTTYYWQIKFWDDTNIEGAFSAASTFTTSTSPTAPTNLFSNDSAAQTGLTNPLGVNAARPLFSAIFHDPDIGDTATKYRIQVSTTNDFSALVWDSGAAGTSMTTCTEGLRCADITYGATTALDLDGTKYYWRIKFFDAAGLESAWSEDLVSTNSFTMSIGGASVQRVQEQVQLNSKPAAPKASSVEVIDSTTLRYNWLDLSNNETGFRLLDDKGKTILEVGPGVTSAQETNLTPNTLVSGRSIVAFNSVGVSDPSPFSSAVTAAPAIRPVLVRRGTNSVTFTVTPSVSNLAQGSSGLLFEVVVQPSDATKQSRVLTSDWIQGLEYTFVGINTSDAVQVRVTTRNQTGLTSLPSTYQTIESLAHDFHVSLNVVKKGTTSLPQPISPLDIVGITAIIKNTGTEAATNVFASMLVPRYMSAQPDKLVIDGITMTDFADEDLGQIDNGTVSAIWPRFAPGEQHTISFDLVFDREALKTLKDEVSASANPLIHLQMSVGFAESDAVFTSPVVTLEPDLGILAPVAEPQPVIVEEPVTPPTNNDVNEITNVLDELIQEEAQQQSQPGAPASPSNPTQTNASYDGGSFNIDVNRTDGNRLSVAGSATPMQNQIEFTGTTSLPNSLITLIFNDLVTVFVTSDANGDWRTFVSAEQLGVKQGQTLQVKIEAIAANGDLRSDKVQVGNVTVGLAQTNDVQTQFETTALASPVLTAVNVMRKEVVKQIVKQEPVIQTTLASAAPVVIVSSVPLWGYLPYLPTLIYHFITYAVGLLGRRRQKRQRFYGVVYDSITKQPLALAIIRIYNKGTNRLVATQVSDKQGRYDVLLEPASYRLEVTKPSYSFPSSIVTADIDGQYQHVYHNEQGLAVQSEEITVPDVPLDPVNAQRQWQISGFAKKLWLAIQNVGNYLAVPVLMVGALASVVVLMTIPNNPINWLLAVLYVGMFAAQLGLRPHLQKAWGVVYDLATNAALPLTTIQLIDPQYGKVVTSRLTDYQGRYSFLPEPGHYVVKVSKPGYEQVQEVLESPKDHQHHPMPPQIEVSKPDERITGDVPMKRKD